MHKRIKMSLSMLSLVILLVLSALPVRAETGTSEQDGISVSYSTDKEHYEEKDEIKTTLSVTNNNAGSIYSVEMEGAVPEGYELAEGSLKYMSIAELKTGESRELETIYVRNRSNSDSDQGTPEIADAEGGNGTSHNDSGDGGSAEDTPKKDAESRASGNTQCLWPLLSSFCLPGESGKSSSLSSLC